MDNWSTSDTLTVLSTLVSIGAVAIALWGWSVNAWRVERRLIKRFGSDSYLPEDIRDATRYYVRPNATSIDLAQEIEDGNNIIATREKLFEAVDRFLDEESSHRHMILLADSGMGKSSFVLNYYDYNRRKWRRRHKIAVIPLGHPSAIERITEITKKNETVLFLDAFDEDPEILNVGNTILTGRSAARPRVAWSYEERLDVLMTASLGFKRVLITCRTQFFPKDAAIPNVATLVVAPRAGKAQHTFWRLYIAPFSDHQVSQYLNRRFKPWSIRKKRKARALAAAVPKLVVRPMLLLHIPDLLRSENAVTSTWEIYEILTEKWYERELGFWRDTEPLRQFSEKVAVQLYLGFLRNGSDRVSPTTIAEIVNDQKQLTGNDDLVVDINTWKATVRSLLNRDGDGYWKFAHRSIMEFLFLKRFFDGDEECQGIQWTDQMKIFFAERCVAIDGAQQTSLVAANLQAADLSNANLRKANLSRTDLSRSDLISADLREIDLRSAILIRANLRDANLKYANLSSAVLRSVALIGANLSDSILENADLREAILLRANLTGSNLEGANLNGANLSGANLTGANLTGANLLDANLRDANLTNANLRRTNLRGASFTWADLSGGPC